MRRKWKVAIFAICCAVPFLLSALPSTRWIVDCHLRATLGRIHVEALGFKQSDLREGWAEDVYDQEPTGPDREARLTRFGYQLGRLDDQADYSTFKQNENDSLFVAAYVLRASHAEIPEPRIPPDNAEEVARHNREVAVKNRVAWHHLRVACEQGMRLEPDNAIYPAIGAAMAQALDDKQQILEFLARAGKCSRWEDHTGELTAIYRRAMRREFGYRGAYALGNVFAFALPSRNLIRLAHGVAKWPMDPTGIEARRDILRFARVGYAAGDRPSDFGRIVSGLAAYGPAPRRPSLSVARHLCLANLHEISLAVAPNESASTEALVREMVAAGDFSSAHGASLDYDPLSDPYWTGPTDWWGMLTFPEGAGQNAFLYGSVLFASLVSGALLIALFSAGRLLPSPASVTMPFVAASAASLIRLFDRWDGLEVAIAASFAAFYLACAWLVKAKRLEMAIFLAALLIPPIALFGLIELTIYDLDKELYHYLLFPICVYAGLFVAYLWRRRHKPSQFFLLPLTSILFAGLTGVAVIWNSFGESFPLGLVCLILLAAIPMTAVASWQGVGYAEAARQLRRYAIGAFAAGCVAYAAFVGWLLAVDARRIEGMRAVASRGPIVRHWAHDHPLGILPEWEKKRL
ncbi:MAG TPA: hypothetical protein VG820_00220 [Fimbriimonadaceae bacterium]|nr:hypothetical protein [Fimbriimonadaceae bacterium]